MQLELRATPEEVMRAVEAFQEFAREQGVQEKVIFGLSLALEECGSNIVNHALKRDPRKTFSVSVKKSGYEFVIELRDNGPGFDPTATVPRKPNAEDDDLPGGWGIELARRHTDAMSYTHKDGENILRLMKKISRGNAPK
jgi:anti-sigma regulatory factor (Ser/Thr protein kinase)